MNVLRTQTSIPCELSGTLTTVAHEVLRTLTRRAYDFLAYADLVTGRKVRYADLFPQYRMYFNVRRLGKSTNYELLRTLTVLA